ncbi:hypothetical protein [uncultured Ilumatobacter sp.]|jgi:hypothetical protein|uniref:hypothetical protein n=1 Tax=uncultured Ilumatobacter sp. TaxID=879968 RepID=UPI00374ED9ED
MIRAMDEAYADGFLTELFYGPKFLMPTLFLSDRVDLVFDTVGKCLLPTEAIR